MKWYTSDEHYFHHNILAYTNRPFKNVNDMNEALIANHNKIVTAEDEVWHLGDFCFGDFDRVKEILKKLNGQHHLIIGNHDKLSWSDYIRAGFKTVQKYRMIKIHTNWTVGLVHDPAVCIIDRNIPWFVGHMHQQFLRMGNAINIGVDVRSFCPVSEISLIEDLNKILISIKHNFKEEAIAKKEILGIE